MTTRTESSTPTGRFSALAALPFDHSRPTQQTAETLQDELIFQRATQTYLWAMPLLNTMGMRDGFGRRRTVGHAASWSSEVVGTRVGSR
jgi:hypothetical protein